MTSSLTGPSAAPLSGKAPKQLIVLLHGYGSNGDDLYGLVPAVAPHFPDAQFLAPNAPYPCEMNPFGGYQWFGLREHTYQAMFGGAHEAEPILDAYLTKQLAHFGLPDAKLALVGFSQGTMMALHVGLRRPNAAAGIVGFSGLLVGDQALKREIKSKPPVCLIHGTMDAVVPFFAMQSSETALKACDVPVETHPRPGLSHSIDAEGIDIAVKFLKRAFAQ
jgi:phospholipase/carboxylesterase